jgi:N6-L-threonylcarbamoyladenine synthase
MNSELITLGVETSCDETAAAVIKGWGATLSSVIASQADIHAKYGGVVPEVASRRHAELIDPVVREALDTAGVTFKDIGLVSVTRGPGLAGALLVGLSYAKALAYGLNVPLVGVNHLEGHVFSAFLTQADAPMPMISLLVSGGHSELFLVEKPGSLKWLSGTRDDAAGEAFDKVAKLLNLGYPGGPEVEKMAKEGEPRFPFPIAMKGDETLDFSFSGLKTAVKLIVRGLESRGEPVPVADICASFQKALVEALALKTKLSVQAVGARSISVVGGVACNTALRERMRRVGAELGLPVIVPSPLLCSDNAVMIAGDGAYRYLAEPDLPKWRDYLDMDADARWAP